MIIPRRCRRRRRYATCIFCAIYSRIYPFAQCAPSSRSPLSPHTSNCATVADHSSSPSSSYKETSGEILTPYAAALAQQQPLMVRVAHSE